jgi:hypothetical protein
MAVRSKIETIKETSQSAECDFDGFYKRELVRLN